MDQNKSTQGQQGRDQQRSQPTREQSQPPRAQTQSQPTRDQTKGSRDKAKSNMGGQERGTGSQGEKNRSGISNRGMSPNEEQLDLPSRGSSDDDTLDQSER